MQIPGTCDYVRFYDKEELRLQIELRFLIIRTTNPKLYMKPQKTPNSQRNLEKEQSEKCHAP